MKPEELEERISKWERIVIKFAGFIALSTILLIVVLYGAIEGVKFLIDRFSH